MEENRPKLTGEVFRRTVELMLAGFGLVAALAWNDAIQSLFAEIFGKQGTLIAKFGYALAVTAIVTFVSIRLARFKRGQE